MTQRLIVTVASMMTKPVTEISAGVGAAGQAVEGRANDFLHDDHEKDRHGGSGNRFEFPVPVGMVRVGRLAGGANADEADDVGRRVGQ